MTEHLVPSLREYTSRYGLTNRRVGAMRDDALVMHPGPMNRGVEIGAEVADLPRSVIIDQVRNGVAVRMAVLYLLLGSGGPDPEEQSTRQRPAVRAAPPSVSQRYGLPSSGPP